MYIAPKLKHRFQIRSTVLTPTAGGGFDQTYETISNIWGDIENIGSFTQAVVQAVRGENTTITVSHIVTFRWVAINNLGKEFNSAFDTGYKGMADLNPLKTQYFLFKQEGSTVKGRLFRILSIMRDERLKEYVKLRVAEVEEIGTGYEKGN